MPMLFYPAIDDAEKGSLNDRIEHLAEAAHRYKAVILDEVAKVSSTPIDSSKRLVPRDQAGAYNWDEISKVLRLAREMPEATRQDKMAKAEVLMRLAEIYEVLRAAKMSKLEAVRLALISEATQLKSGI
jgi:predicted transcriptional regulator